MQKLTCRYVDKWIYIGRSELTSTLPEVATGLDLKASIEGQIPRTLSDYVRINMRCNA